MPKLKCETFRADPLDVTGACSLVCCGMLSDEVSWQERRHAHEGACELLLVAQGSGTVTLENHRYPVREGDLIFYNEGTAHAEHFPAQQAPIRLYYAVLRDVTVRGMKDNRLVPEGVSPVIPSGKELPCVRGLFELLVQECRQQDSGYERAVQGMAQALLTVAIRLANDQYRLMLSGNALSLDQRIREYIEANCTGDLSLRSIAKHFHISHYYLEHLFKQCNGVSPIGYLIRYRMNKVSTLLETTSLSVKTIAASFGYDNPAYFSLAFKKVMGLSPAAYRATHRKPA